MAHFAKLGKGNLVEQIISINNYLIIDNNGVEQEQLGVDFINKLYNTRDVWKQTSYSRSFRKNFAGIGYTYNSELDAFIPERPYNSWILNEDTCTWKAPVDKPNTILEENQYYSWNESVINWEVKTI
jgi:hypothetical protein